jgi:hypothetical protein
MTRNTLSLLILPAVLASTGFLAGCGSNPASADAAAKDANSSKPSIIRRLLPKPDPVTVAAGSTLRVRTNVALSTKANESGDAFTATLVEPLVADGKVIAPRGATVRGVVANSDPGGRIKGVARLAVRLTEIDVPSEGPVTIATNVLSYQARTTKKRDAAKIGIGSGIGAAIGAIAGGGKGAAIGAGAGAGAGTGVVLATRGAPAVLPAESLLAFRLAQPVTVTPNS